MPEATPLSTALQEMYFHQFESWDTRFIGKYLHFSTDIPSMPIFTFAFDETGQRWVKNNKIDLSQRGFCQLSKTEGIEALYNIAMTEGTPSTLH